MQVNYSTLKPEERAAFQLREIYGKYGYTQYKMSKFEEYELYVRNKDFLISDSIITFTDTNGKLMALKPDVTLSIIKNTKDEPSYLKKVFYNENVYRITKGSHSYKEIMQTGLECLGAVDSYTIYEVLKLACESLKSISNDSVLDISHLGILSNVINNVGISEENKSLILKCASEKNTHEIVKICNQENISEEKMNVLRTIITSYGKADEVISSLEAISEEYIDPTNLNELKAIVNALCLNGYRDMIRIDFSVINDMNYYNGVVFKGFVNTIPTGVLSGGQYDNLMKKMGKKSKAIGFAVYLDMLERFGQTEKTYDIDVLLLYGDNDSIEDLNNTISMLSENGKSVMAQRNIPEDIKYKQLLKIKDKGVVILENHA